MYILNNIATCNFYFSVSGYVCTLLLQTIVVKSDYMYDNKWNTLIAALYLTINILSPITSIYLLLRAYCNFESKQANSINLFGRRPNKKPFWSCARQPKLKAFRLKIETHKSTIFYFYAIISSPRSNGAKMSNYKPKGEQKIIFLSSILR